VLVVIERSPLIPFIPLSAGFVESLSRILQGREISGQAFTLAES
jgi:hypothetical protein